MFTIVNSAKKDKRNSVHLNESTSPALLDSESSKNNYSILKRFSKYFLISDDFLILQLKIISLTFAVSIVLSLSTSLFVSRIFGLSIFIGSVVGIFYLRLLAKSIWNLGKTSSGVSKVQ